MPNREIICILYNYLMEEKHEVTDSAQRKATAEIVDRLTDRLVEQDKEDFNELLSLWLNMECNSNEDSFVLGFRTGFKLASEVNDHGN